MNEKFFMLTYLMFRIKKIKIKICEDCLITFLFSRVFFLKFLTSQRNKIV